MVKPVWLITGASSGLGHALAREVLASGYRAALCVRNLASLDLLRSEYPDQVLSVQLDLAIPESIEHAVREVVDHFGTIDILVNNAGVSYIAGIEEAMDAGVRWQFEANFFGPAALTRAVLPTMRAQRSGIVINISSQAAIVPVAGSGFYSASKLALEGLSEALRLEVAPLGIKVLIVEPGGFATAITGSTQFGNSISDYKATSGALREWVENADPGDFPGDLERGAAAILHLAESQTPPPRAILGSDAFDTIIARCEELRASWQEGEALARSTDRTQ